MYARFTAAAALLVALAPSASAQTFPSGNIKLIVGYAAGGTGDIVARVLAEKMQSVLGQTVVVENRAGASGSIAAQAVASSAPDGHTLLMGQPAEVAINQHFGGLAYDPEKDLQVVTIATVVPLALVAPGNTPHADLKATLKSASGKGLSFASAGTGTPGHFAGELLKLKTNTAMTHIPYRGAGPALNDLLGGHVDMFFSGFPAAWPHVQTGKLKLLAVSTAKRTGAAPNAPTVAEAAGIEFDVALWQGVFAPSRTPKEVVAKLNAEIVKILNQPDVKEKLMAAGADVAAMSADESAAFVKTEIGKYQLIVKEAGIKAN